MKLEQHKIAAEKHFSIAKEIDNELEKEVDEEKRLAVMTVAAQNYYYAGINALEAVFAKKQTHHGKHEHRLRDVQTMPHLFKNNLILRLYTDAEELRNAVAYRAVNGKKYEKMKEFAIAAMDEIND